MFLDRIEPKSYDLIFYIGIFFLPTFPIFASILFLFLLVKGSLENKYSYFSDKLNIPFFYSGIFSILSCIYITFIQTDKLTGYSHYLTWIGLFNLLPFFLCFWVFQSFTFQTNTKKNYWDLFNPWLYPNNYCRNTSIFLWNIWTFSVFKWNYYLAFKRCRWIPRNVKHI